MGMETVLLGYITEPWIGNDKNRERLLRRCNRRVLSELPSNDTWPPLARGLFAWSQRESLRGGYRGTIIHFGGKFKSIEYEWDEWLVKYEKLLTELFWESSVVHLDTELFGSFRFEWHIASWDCFVKSPPEHPTVARFDGPFRRWSDYTSSLH